MAILTVVEPISMPRVLCNVVIYAGITPASFSKKQETKNTMNWIREDMKKRDDSDIKKLLGANEEELKPLMSWVKKEAKKRGIIK